MDIKLWQNQQNQINKLEKSHLVKRKRGYLKRKEDQKTNMKNLIGGRADNLHKTNYEARSQKLQTNTKTEH